MKQPTNEELADMVIQHPEFDWPNELVTSGDLENEFDEARWAIIRCVSRLDKGQLEALIARLKEEAPWVFGPEAWAEIRKEDKGEDDDIK